MMPTMSTDTADAADSADISADAGTSADASTPPPPLVWIDLEMSGLDPDNCRILEIATLVTDADLKVLGEGPDLVTHQPDGVLEAMDSWCTEHHRDSGLTASVKESTLSVADAERRTLSFLRDFCKRGESPLCGNSVYMDRLFINRYMPKLGAYLHYRTVDVTTIKELARRWYPDLDPPPKQEAHRAMDDIRESIAELQYYRETLFRVP
jgi:oligoribonuclease